MSTIGQRERDTQNRVVALFQSLGYRPLGNWQDRPGNSCIDEALLGDWLNSRVDPALATGALRQLRQAAAMGDGKKLYQANKDVYSALRYGVRVRTGQGDNKKTVWLIDWAHPENNDFAIAEEVTVRGELTKRPDVVLYVNGIALAVLELKRSSVSASEGIRQNLDNQKPEFIRDFFATVQLVLAGNDSEGLRYGTVETPERHFYRWKEQNPAYRADNTADDRKHLNATEDGDGLGVLDFDLTHLCKPARLLELVHDFIVFDEGVKKTCRPNQYFGVKAAQARVRSGDGGILWHTQGSGKSLTMVWLAKWVREHVTDARVLVITDRTELDEQIEGVFLGVDETISRTTSGADLVSQLNQAQPWLMCSLVHKFGHQDDDTERTGRDYFHALTRQLPADFSPKGRLFVFVDECHRTQSGKLHEAMKKLMPKAVFFGFTGTPLLKKDKQKSIEVFGSFIHTYKFNEAVDDGVVLDLRYEARDIDQYLTSTDKVDTWFEAKTRGLSDMAKVQLKQKWGTLQKVLSSQSRLERIVDDILLDMDTKGRLMDGRGNAMLVCASIYQACKVYELFDKTDLRGKCAIVTSYLPSPADLKGQTTGEGLSEQLHQYEIYQKMLADFFEVPPAEAINRAEEFEKRVKQRFKDEPGQMRLLIVVDKLLTGFDAPSATYLYIDKKMADHGLFQAICRVNRLDGDDKEYGYIVDYKDLFHSLASSITDYTSGAFDAYDASDVAGLLTDRLEKGRETLDTALETVRALCEPVMHPRELIDYQRYFCGDVQDADALRANEAKRVALYKDVAALVRAYVNLANEMPDAGYSDAESRSIKDEVEHYSAMRAEIRLSSRDSVDMKLYEPAMRRMLDIYIRADDSERLVDFNQLGLVELVIYKSQQLPALPDTAPVPEAMAETIENNIRKVIIDGQPINPKYYERMSELLDALIAQRREGAQAYAAYLKAVKALAEQVEAPGGQPDQQRYPDNINTPARQSLYDNLDQNADLAIRVDAAVRKTKKADWKSNRFKTREVEHAVRDQVAKYKVDIKKVMGIIKNQRDYD